MAIVRALLSLVVLSCSSQAVGEWYWQDPWMSRDQQGQFYFKRGDYAEAARRFEDSRWRATALYADQRFSEAAILFGRLNTAEGWFNQGNALAHLERYPDAVNAYRKALAEKPDWQAARENLSLAETLGSKPEEVDDYGSGKATEIGADKVVFESGTDRMKQAQESVDVEASLSEQQANELWMRRLQTTPADFLRNKFLFQTAEQQSDGEPVQ